MPGPWEVSISTPRIMQDPLAFLLRMTHKYGDSVSFNLPEEKARLLNHPDLIQHVLQTNSRNYTKQTPQFKTFALVTGNGLLNSDGRFWLQQRRIAQPAFHQHALTNLEETIVCITAKTADRWAQLAQPVDIEREMLRLTFNIIMRALFTLDVSDRVNALVEEVEAVLKYVLFRAQTPFAAPLTWPLRVNRRYQAAMGTLDALVYELIAARRAQANPPPDVLGQFLAARDADTGEPLPDKVLRDEVMTLIIAGYETAATGLTWLWHLLDQHPDIAAELHTELDFVLNGRLPTVNDLPQLPLLRQIVDETLRLYPPSWLISRAAAEDDMIGGQPIAAGTLIIISPYVLHRHPQFWPQPEQFWPQRFAEGHGNGRSRFAYIPFGAGPRLCIGNHFALMEMQLIVATLAQRFHLRGHGKRSVRPTTLVTIRPRSGLPMQITPR